MTVYLWLAGMGVVGLIALLLFIAFLMKDLKMKKKRNLSFLTLLPTWLLLLLSSGSFAMMVYFFLNVKEQLVQFGN